jgi:ABC-type iron transport system FetAB ATPase subunit
LKEKVLELHPELADISGEENIREALGKALQEAWDALLEDLFTSSIERMEKRVKACIKAKGWHTKYWILIEVFTLAKLAYLSTG